MRITIVSLVVVCAAIIGVRLFHHYTRNNAESKLTTPQNSNYYMYGAIASQFNKKGNLAYRMTIASTLHFPDRSAKLSNIAIRYFGSAKTHWNMTAAHGYVPAGTHDVYLYGGVKGRHPQPGDTVARLATPHLWIRTRTNRLDSDAPVRISDPRRTITGDGMRANMKTDRLKLLRNVHVTYAP